MRHHRGYTIMEMLTALMLIGVASLMGARLFGGSMLVIRTAPASQEYFAAIDRLSEGLRTDVWAAAKVDVPDEHTLVLTDTKQKTIRWELSKDGVDRKSGDDEKQWKISGSPDLTISRQGSQVVLKGPGGDALRFNSQMLAMNGGAR